MNREQMRTEFKRLKKMTLSQFKKEMNIVHTRSYNLCDKHYQEAMFIVLEPKQREAVTNKAKEIKELWDGIQEVTLEDTERMLI